MEAKYIIAIIGYIIYAAALFFSCRHAEVLDDDDTVCNGK